MTDLLNDPTTLEAATLLTHYSFDLGNHTQEELMRYWLSRYPATWVRAAIIEALYQGRYKAVSVDHILGLWHRRRHPCQHFNHEFERIICGNRTRPFMTLEPSSSLPPATAPSGSNSPATTSPALAPPEQEAAVSDSSPPSQEASDPDSVSSASDPGHACPEEVIESGGIQAFKPDALTELHLPAETVRHRGAWGHHPIDQFTPTADMPEFYIKFQSSVSLHPIGRENSAGKEAIATAHPSE